jgi:Rrf2 family protein
MTGEFAVAVHALVYLHKRNEALDSEALSVSICTNPARVRKVMARLRRAGLVEARIGAEGGYRFQLDPSKVTLRQVAEALSVSPIAACWRPGDPKVDCPVCSGMAAALDRVYDDLNWTCLERLSQVSLSDMEALLAPEK